MVWSVVWVEAIAFMALFTAMVLAPALRGHPGSVRKRFLAKIAEEAFRKQTDYSLFERTDMYLWYGIGTWRSARGAPGAILAGSADSPQAVP